MAQSIPMHILVTGSSGQLGAEVCRQLKAAGHHVRGIDILPGLHTDQCANISDRTAVDQAIQQVEAVIHTASLHAPHVPTYSRQQFIDVNITGTLNLLEAAAAARVERFVYTSTTSVYGYAMVPNRRAVWVTEALTPQPRDIYDITKLAAEELCRDVARSSSLPTICLRTCRFFPEPDELMAIYRLYRGADIRDIAQAHLLAVQNQELQFEIFNIAARSPFQQSDTAELLENARATILRYYPAAEELFQQRGWHLPQSVDRVYVITRAEELLGYHPRFNFSDVYLHEA